MSTTTTHNANIIKHAIDNLERLQPGVNTSEVHQHLFNEDYFIIGRYEAALWLQENPGVFTTIGEVQKYEKDNFGEVTTDLAEPEKVANMYAYIKGEELLQDCTIITKKWNEKLTEKDIITLKRQLQNLLK